jgi:hypothetical protein
MKPLVLLALAALIAGCSSDDASKSDGQAPVGSDRDPHGCISSAGYVWCAHTDKCERPWELAEKEGFENTPEQFSSYCTQ